MTTMFTTLDWCDSDKELLLTEIENLKKYATKEELARLDFESLNPVLTGYCIYGQITGNCYNVRAMKLKAQCCSTVFSSECFPNKHRIKFNDLTGFYFTPIEAAILVGADVRKEIFEMLTEELIK